MKDHVHDSFLNRPLNISKAKEWGFVEEDGLLTFHKKMPGGDLLLTLIIDKEGILHDSMIDTVTGDLFTLHLVDKAHGNFVGDVKASYEDMMASLLPLCVHPPLEISEQEKEILEWAKATYGEERDNPFKEEGFFVLRRKDNQKWYALFSKIGTKNVGFPADPKEAFVNIRFDRESIASMYDEKVFFPAFHMTKKSWITIMLDRGLSQEELIGYLEKSHQMAAKK